MRRIVTPISSSSHARAPHEPSFGPGGAGSAARRSSILGSSAATMARGPLEVPPEPTSSAEVTSRLPSSLPLSLSDPRHSRLELRLELRLLALSRSHLSTIPRTRPYSFVFTHARHVGRRTEPVSTSSPASGRSSELDEEAYSAVPKGPSSCPSSCSCSCCSWSDAWFPQIRPRRTFRRRLRAAARSAPRQSVLMPRLNQIK
ncbi:hypothetical protein BJV78DRAFT_792917 [Lactifluus subvellereus]|nr:hypothetical protein BJV78DRAFT_792917 [Lactifluus subvellereus]